jgi:hypothetical protein
MRGKRGLKGFFLHVRINAQQFVQFISIPGEWLNVARHDAITGLILNRVRYVR